MKKLFDSIIKPSQSCMIVATHYNELDLDLSKFSKNVCITTSNIKEAKKAYEHFDYVVPTEIPHKEVTTGIDCFGLGLFENTRSKEELIWSMRLINPFRGILVYRYDHLYNDMKVMVEEHLCLGIIPLLVIEEDEKKYIVAKRISLLVASCDTFENYEKVFVQPFINLDNIEKSNLPEFHPFSGYNCGWHENNDTGWRAEFFINKSRVRNDILSKIRKEKYMGGTIKAPNKEQAAIAIASGRFDREVLLEDGRVFIFKGTERIIEEERIKTSITNEPQAVRKIYKRQAMVYGFDMTNGEFVEFN